MASKINLLLSLTVVVLSAGCATVPLPPDLDLAQARLVPMAAPTSVNVTGLRGGKGVGAGVGAGAGTGYGALAGGAACLATGPFAPFCFVFVVPTTMAVGAVSGAIAGALRTETAEAVADRTRALEQHVAAASYHEQLARQLQQRLNASLPTPIALAGAEPDADHPWRVELGVTELATEGNGHFVLRLSTRLRVTRSGSTEVWQSVDSVRSTTELTTEQWLADDSAALRRVVDRCIETAARHFADDLVGPAIGKAGQRRPPGRRTQDCGDELPAALQMAAKP